jgi:fermentation-respiration switch protein FrsA (DUF1100 family)
MKLRWRIAAYIVFGYAMLVAMLLFLENKLVYHPYTAADGWMTAPNGEFNDVDLASADGTKIHAWFCPSQRSDQALLLFHGNAGNLSHRGELVADLSRSLDVSVLIVDYPGYGKSAGSPSEQGCYDAADAGYDWLTEQKKFAPTKIILFGESLGGGVATELASRRDHRALVLVKTFTSLPDVASDIYWWLPVPKHALMRNRFESLARLPSCRRPIFIAHGDADGIVPFKHGQRLYEAAAPPKQFLRLPGHGHNDPLPREFFEELKNFLLSNPVK